MAFFTSLRSRTAMSWAFFSSIPFTASSASSLEVVVGVVKCVIKTVVSNGYNNIASPAIFQPKPLRNSHLHLHLPQCQSTNDELARIWKEKNGLLPDGFRISTDFQTAGRGQRGNTWESEPGKNLLFSLLVRPTFLPASQSFWISAAACLGLHRVLAPALPQLTIKWPNDLLAGDKKICGMLVENASLGGFIERSVVGIGLNVNSVHVPVNASSLRLECDYEWEMGPLLERICESIGEEVNLLGKHGWEFIRNRMLARLYKIAQVHTFYTPEGDPFPAILKTIRENGQLVLVGKEGEKTFDFKEISFFPNRF